MKIKHISVKGFFQCATFLERDQTVETKYIPFLSDLKAGRVKKVNNIDMYMPFEVILIQNKPVHVEMTFICSDNVIIVYNS